MTATRGWRRRAAGVVACAGTACLALAARPAGAQGIPIPRMRSDAAVMLELGTGARPAEQAVGHWRSYEWATNILPLSQGEDEEYPPLRFEGSNPFVQRNKRAEVAWERRGWRLSAGSGEAFVLRGTPDAAQAWLDLKADRVEAGRFYQTAAAQSEAEWRWIGVQREIAGRVAGRPARAWVGLRAMEALSFREYSFGGTFRDERLQGQLGILSWRDIQKNTSRGLGWGGQIGAAWEWRPGARVLVDVDGLGRASWSRVRELTADVDTGAFFLDTEGFVHDLPVLSGQEQMRRLSRPLEAQWRAGASYPLGTPALVALVSRRYSRTQWSLGAAQPLGARSRLLLHAIVPAGMVEATYSGRGVLVSAGTDNVSIGRARVIHLEAGAGFAF